MAAHLLLVRTLGLDTTSRPSQRSPEQPQTGADYGFDHSIATSCKDSRKVETYIRPEVNRLRTSWHLRSVARGLRSRWGDRRSSPGWGWKRTQEYYHQPEPY